MRLTDFELTKQNGLYLSKEEHPTFGKKYVARFQYDKKRYVKVLGYTKRDGLTLQKAINLIEDFREQISNTAPILEQTKETQKKQDVKKEKIPSIDNRIKTLEDENVYLKSILKDYKKLDPDILEEGIQKIYDLQELKPYR